MSTGNSTKAFVSAGELAATSNKTPRNSKSCSSSTAAPLCTILLPYFLLTCLLILSPLHSFPYGTIPYPFVLHRSKEEKKRGCSLVGREEILLRGSRMMKVTMAVGVGKKGRHNLDPKMVEIVPFIVPFVPFSLLAP